MDGRLARGETTRRQLLSVATELFATQGYERTSLEQVLAAAGASKGSLYHHFASKRDLFEGVLEEVEATVAEKTTAAARGADGPLEALRAGCRTWLRLARDPRVRQIVLVDAPTVVGWERWREIDERHAFGLIKDAVLAARGGRTDAAAETVAHVLLASLVEMALLIARSDRPRVAIREAEAATDVLLDALVPG